MENAFTIYDVMEKKGVFKLNPANISSKEYVGPVSYPRMLYHPKGELVKVAQGEIIVTPFGPQIVGERWDLVTQVVNSAEEEKVLLKDGWHTHPARAIEASGKKAPAVSSEARIKELQETLARTQAELTRVSNLA